MNDIANEPLGPLDLEISRRIDVAPKYVWAAWTKPEHVRHWFAPKPWEITACTIDLRPGGAFDSTMKGPDGTEMPMRGCILEVVPERRLVTTDTLVAGWRPAPKPFFTAIVTMEPVEGGTLYRARALHGNEKTHRQHVAMGFTEGWGTVAGQLADYAGTLRDADI